MKTVLVIAARSGLGAAVKEILGAAEYSVICHEQVWEAQSLLVQGLIDLCVLDAELTDIQPIRIIRDIRRLHPPCPVVIYASAKQWEWEEEAYLLGVENILAKPVRGGLLLAVLSRLWGRRPAPDSPPRKPSPPEPAPVAEPRPSPERTLRVLSELSDILAHSLSSDSLLRECLRLLREILGVNRAAIFLRQPTASGCGIPSKPEDLLLRPVCALGLPPELLDHLVLSQDRGIGHYIYRFGRILKSAGEEARQDPVAQKEFALLGVQVAIPILDRESVIGVAVFDGRVTGEFFANEELALIFHLLERVGLAIKNSWLYDQLAGNNRMLTDILNELEHGCLVVDREMKVLHANPAAKKFFLPPGETGRAVGFHDLPQVVGGKVFQTLQGGAPQPAFTYRPKRDGETVYEVRIVLFGAHSSPAANAALLLVADVTHQERFRLLELESANLRLIKTMAAQMAHEIGNAMVPVAACLELGRDPKGGAEKPQVLSDAAFAGLRRISRLTKQMQLLADDEISPGPERDIRAVVADAYALVALDKTASGLLAQPSQELPSVAIECDSAKLAHALAEIILNALQSTVSGKPVEVDWTRRIDTAGNPTLRVEIRDGGPGFTAEEANRATEPFFSTRTVGLGLGLTVAQRIVEAHHGRIEFAEFSDKTPNIVRIHLPLPARA